MTQLTRRKHTRGVYPRKKEERKMPFDPLRFERVNRPLKKFAAHYKRGMDFHRRNRNPEPEIRSIKRELSRRLAGELLEEGYINISVSQLPHLNEVHFRAEIWAAKEEE